MSSSIPQRIGRYEIVRRLGAGGMGVVYLATDPMLRRMVAIKVLPASDDQHLRERFLREAQSVAALRHPNIVTIHDIGEEQGQMFIAMERVDGESMADAINGGGAYSLERKLQLMLDLCAGLGYAHKQGIIHRDIKPGNLMIATDGSLKVLDFGLARTAALGQTGLTQSGALVGTPNYMSPEQVSGQPLDHRSDIFSVGLVLYEWLSSRRAFSGESIHTILHDIVYKDPTPLPTLMPEIDPSLAAAVGKALQKDPSLRHQSLDALAADLRRVLDRGRATKDDRATVIVARPDTAETAILAPPAAPPSRRRAMAGLAALIAVGAVSGYLLVNRPADPAAALPDAGVAPPRAANASPEAPPPAPVAAARTGDPATLQTVSVDVLPWARVRIVAVGHDAVVPNEAMVTPFSVELAPGDYRLECENGGLSPRTVFPITVTAGRPLSVNRAMQGFNPAQVVDALVGPPRP